MVQGQGCPFLCAKPQMSEFGPLRGQGSRFLYCLMSFFFVCFCPEIPTDFAGRRPPTFPLTSRPDLLSVRAVVSCALPRGIVRRPVSPVQRAPSVAVSPASASACDVHRLPAAPMHSQRSTRRTAVSLFACL
jgi:hypothetical protein